MATRHSTAARRGKPRTTSSKHALAAVPPTPRTRDRASPGTRVQDYGAGISAVTRRATWIISTTSPKTVDDLPFVSRSGDGASGSWWDVMPPKTDYYHAHEMLGRAYAFDVLDLMHTPGADCPPRILEYVMTAVANRQSSIDDWPALAVAQGFFGAISEFLVTGSSDR